jgi:type IV fimbrial biogenesis protein FimT
MGKRAAGFTWVELAIVLTVSAILAVLAIPSMEDLLVRTQIRSTREGLAGVLREARETAVLAQNHTLVCPSRDARTCDAGARWEQGWILGYNADRDKAPDLPLLRIHEPVPARLTVTTYGARSKIRFSPDGAASGSNLTLLICRRGDRSRALSLIVADSGRIRRSIASDSQAAYCGSR